LVMPLVVEPFGMATKEEARVVLFFTCVFIVINN
jgi:hypothetical protein